MTSKTCLRCLHHITLKVSFIFMVLLKVGRFGFLWGSSKNVPLPNCGSSLAMTCLKQVIASCLLPLTMQVPYTRPRCWRKTGCLIKGTCSKGSLHLLLKALAPLSIASTKRKPTFGDSRLAKERTAFVQCSPSFSQLRYPLSLCSFLQKAKFAGK